MYAKLILISSLQLRIQFKQRLNGWKPFLYDFRVGCNFTRHLNKLTNLIWEITKNISNVRTDCPYTVSKFVEKIHMIFIFINFCFWPQQDVYEVTRVDNRFIENALSILPIPPGDYGVFFTLAVNKVPRGYFQVHVAIT